MKTIKENLVKWFALLKLMLLTFIEKNTRDGLQDLEVQKLEVKDLPKIMRLHKKVMRQLVEEGNELFVLPKTEAEFFNFVTQYAVFGVFDPETNNLIGILNLYFPEKDYDFYSEYIDLSNIDLKTAFMIKTLEVDSDYRGRHIASLLRSAAEEYALEHDRYISITDIAFENYGSLRVFLRAGYAVFKAFHPKDDIQIVTVIKDLYSEMESVSEGRKVIAFNLGSYAEVVAEIENGFYPTLVQNKDTANDGQFVLEQVPELTELFAKEEALTEAVA